MKKVNKDPKERSIQKEYMADKYKINGPIYRQEGKFGLYQSSLPFLATHEGMQKYLQVTYGEMFGFGQNSRGIWLFYEQNMKKVTDAFLSKTRNGFPSRWQNLLKDSDKKIASSARQIGTLNLEEKTMPILRSLHDDLWQLARDMWDLTIFIDAFDAGFDQVEIDRISKRYAFTRDETETLLTSGIPSYINAWEQRLHELRTGKINYTDIKQEFFCSFFYCFSI